MPNHIHFLVHANSQSVLEERCGCLELSRLSIGFKNVLSSYARALNKQESRTGSLFQQNTKCKMLQDWHHNFIYDEICFYYIHQNPVRAGLVENIADWPFSSIHEYTGRQKTSICNIDLASQIMNIDWKTFIDSLAKIRISAYYIKKIH